MLFRSNQAFTVEHPPGGKPGLSGHFQHFLGLFQLFQGLFVVTLGEFRLKILPKAFNGRLVPGSKGADESVGAKGAEFIDMVSLPGVTPSGKELEVVAVIDVIPPGSDIADPDVRISRQQSGRFAVGHNGDYGSFALLQAIGFNRGQSLVLIAVRPWNGVIEDPAAVMGIPDQETPCGNSPTGVENRPPHQFRAQGILTDAVITGLIEFPECGGVFLGYGFELQHKTHIPCQNYEARVAAAGRPRERRAEQILMIENIFLEMGREFLDAGRKI